MDILSYLKELFLPEIMCGELEVKRAKLSGVAGYEQIVRLVVSGDIAIITVYKTKDIYSVYSEVGRYCHNKLDQDNFLKYIERLREIYRESFKG